MFDRKKYKKFARVQLKKRWTVPVIMTLICTFIVGLIEFPDITASINLLMSDGEELTQAASIYSEIRTLIVLVVSLVLIYAETHVFLKMSTGPEPVSLGDFFEGFIKWPRSIAAGLWQELWENLWTLVFIIPGIVKHYAYSMTKFIVMEYPEISVTKALKISMVITRGHKMDIFLTELSFLGWAILATIPCFLGFLWLIPYMQMTMTNVYHALLTEAIETNKLKKEDLTN